MSADIRPITSKDISTLLPLIEQYWIFEDVASFDSARVTKELQRFCGRYGIGYVRADAERPFEEIVLKAFRQGRLLG